MPNTPADTTPADCPADIANDPAHHARWRKVAYLYVMGANKADALREAGLCADYYTLWDVPTFKDMLRHAESEQQSELGRMRKRIVHELACLARDTQQTGHVRVRAYQILGRWAGLEPDKVSTLPLPGDSTTDPQHLVVPGEVEVLDEIDTLRKQAKNRATGPKNGTPADSAHKVQDST